MPWVRFLEDYDWRPKKTVIIAYKKGMTALVPQAAFEKSIAAGKAEQTQRPGKINDYRR